MLHLPISPDMLFMFSAFRSSLVQLFILKPKVVLTSTTYHVLLHQSISMPRSDRFDPVCCQSSTCCTHAVCTKARKIDEKKFSVESFVVHGHEDEEERALCNTMDFKDNSVRVDLTKALQVCYEFGLFDRTPFSATEAPGQMNNINDASNNVDEYEEVSLPPNATYGDLSTGQRRSRGRRATSHLTEEQIFDAAIGKLIDLQHLLQERRGSEHLRIVHIELGGREASLVTVRLKEGNRTTRHACILWQIKSSPPRFVCISFHRTADNVNLITECTCSPYEDKRCIHSEQVLKNERLIEFLEKILNASDPSDGTHQLFSYPMIATDNDAPQTWPLVMLPRYNDAILSSNGLADKLKKKWAPWIVFDKEQRLFVAVTKRPKLPVQCQMCRCSKRELCDHEDVVRDILKDRGLYDYIEEHDNDASNITHETDNNGQHSSLEGNMDVWTYCPLHLSRPILPCHGEHKLINKLYDRINQTPVTSPIDFKDAQFHCLNDGCSNNIPRHEISFKARNCVTTLVTLEKGPVRAHFHDWRCLRCGKLNFYSGRSDGIFPVRKLSAYSTDFLYCLMDLSCRIGLSQRNAYEALNIVSNLENKIFLYWAL